jgi:hypothetical protein
MEGKSKEHQGLHVGRQEHRKTKKLYKLKKITYFLHWTFQVMQMKLVRTQSNRGQNIMSHREDQHRKQPHNL